MTQNTPERPDVVDLLALYREQQNAVPALHTGRIDFTQIRTRLGVTDSSEVDHMVVEVEKLRLGQEAFDLGHEYLEAGNLHQARHWLTLAAKYDTEEARPLLDDVEVILEALNAPQTTAINDGTALEQTDPADEPRRHATIVDNFHDAADVLRTVQEHAKSIVATAQSTAADILTHARREADPHEESIFVPRSLRLDTATYQRVLGDELRRLRKQRGWTRRDLNRRLQSDISLQTLATYELGTRQCSVVRLVEICLALGEVPHELLTRVHQRVFSDSPVGRIRIDLRKVIRDTQPELLPLRRWAKGKLAESDDYQPAEMSLDISALERMAELCGLETVELITRLRTISGVAEPVE